MLWLVWLPGVYVYVFVAVCCCSSLVAVVRRVIYFVLVSSAGRTARRHTIRVSVRSMQKIHSFNI